MTRIVVGVDGSEQSQAALRWAAREADLRDADLTVVLVWDLFNQHHVDGSKKFDPAYDGTDAEAALQSIVERTLGAERAASVDRQAMCEVPAPGLLDAAKDADLLVVGARGLGGFRGLLLGSVSQQVLHHATGPVAVVRSGADASPPEGGTERIVVGVDGSDPSRAALRWALTEGRLRSATVEAVHAWDVPMIYGPVGVGFPYDTQGLDRAAHELLDQIVEEVSKEVADQAGAAAVTVERTVTPGGPATGVLDAAEDADLIVVGRRGAGGFQRLLLGSVSDHVARHATCPVVVLPADKGGDTAPTEDTA
jgi:nucleotide-binding universal stress UspA family protein